MGLAFGKFRRNFGTPDQLYSIIPQLGVANFPERYVEAANTRYVSMVRPAILAALGLSIFSLSPVAGGQKVRPRRNRHRDQDWPDCAIQRADLFA